MAIDNQFGKGIGLAAGFDLGAQKPLDSRVAVNTIAERDAHVTENRAYEGMIVFVDETKLNYQLVNGVWQELTKAEKDRLDALEAMLNGGEGVEGSNGVLGALQDAIDDVNERLDNGGDIDNRIAQNASNIDALEKELADEIGVPSVPADENGEGAKTATGMHKVIEDAAVELRGAIQEAIGGAEAAVATEKLRAETQEGLIRQELANEKLALQKEIDDDIKAESDLRVAEEGRIEGKVDQEVIDRKAAVKEVADDLAQEVQDRKDAVQGVQDQIDAINDEEDGILAQAKALDKKDREDQALVDQEQDRRLGLLEAANAEGGAVKEAIEAAQKAADDAQDAADAAQADVDAIEKRLDDPDGLVDRLEAVEASIGDGGNLEARVQQAEEDIDALEGLVGVPAQDGKAGTGLHGALDTAKEEIQGDIQDALNSMNTAVSGEATARDNADKAIRQEMAAEAERVDQKIADDIAAESALRQAAEKKIADDLAAEIADRAADEAKLAEDFQKALDKAVEAIEGDAGDLADRVKANEDAIKVINGEGEGSIKKAISDLIDGAPEATNTLNELAQAIKDNKDIYDGWVAAHEQSMATMKSDLQKEIDDDVKAEADLRVAADNKIREDFAAADSALEGRVNQKIANDIAAESALRVAEEQRIEQECEAAMVQEVKDRDAAILVEKQRAVAEEGKLQAAIEKEVEDREAAVSGEAQARQQADEALDGRLDKLEAKIDVNGQSVADQIAGLKSDLEGQMATEKAARDKKDGEQDKALTNAIAQEVIDRNAAIKVVYDELAKQKDPAQDGTLANLIADEAARADAEEKDIRADFAAEDQKLQALIDEMKNVDKEGSLANLIAALRSDLGKHLTTEAYDGDKHYDDLAAL